MSSGMTLDEIKMLVREGMYIIDPRAVAEAMLEHKVLNGRELSDDTKSRIRALDYEGYKQNEIERMCGVSAGAINHALRTHERPCFRVGIPV